MFDDFEWSSRGREQARVIDADTTVKSGRADWPPSLRRKAQDRKRREECWRTFVGKLLHF